MSHEYKRRPLRASLDGSNVVSRLTTGIRQDGEVSSHESIDGVVRRNTE